MLVREALPGVRIALLKRQSLSVRAVAENCWKTSFSRRTEHICSQHQAIVGADADVPVDPHAVSNLIRSLEHLFPCDPCGRLNSSSFLPPLPSRASTSQTHCGSIFQTPQEWKEQLSRPARPNDF